MARNNGTSSTTKGEMAHLEARYLRQRAESKIKEAVALEEKACRSGDEELPVVARAKRAEAREYFAAARRKTGPDDFMAGMGL